MPKVCGWYLSTILNRGESIAVSIHIQQALNIGNHLHSRATPRICRASSRVGVITTMPVPLRGLNLSRWSISTAGIRKASVLPLPEIVDHHRWGIISRRTHAWLLICHVPVLAAPKISLPVMAAGIQRACTSVMVVKPISTMALAVGSLSDSSAKALGVSLVVPGEKGRHEVVSSLASMLFTAPYYSRRLGRSHSRSLPSWRVRSWKWAVPRPQPRPRARASCCPWCFSCFDSAFDTIASATARALLVVTVLVVAVALVVAAALVEGRGRWSVLRAVAGRGRD